MYYLSLLWTIRWKAYAAAKVFEEMPTIITTYFIHDNYIASISLFEKKSLKVILLWQNFAKPQKFLILSIEKFKPSQQ